MIAKMAEIPPLLPKGREHVRTEEILLKFVLLVKQLQWNFI